MAEACESSHSEVVDALGPVADAPCRKEVISLRISNFAAPPGFSTFKPKRTDDSIAYSYGVRVVKDGLSFDAFKEGAYFCLASVKCAGACRRFSVKKSLSVATTHLQHVHGVTGHHTQQHTKRKNDQEQLSVKRSRELADMDPARFWLLSFVIMIVKLLLPFRMIEMKAAQNVLSGIPAFPLPTSSNTVRRMIVEIYTAAKGATVECLANARTALGDALPLFHLNIDRWKSTSSHAKYIGVRVFFSDGNFNFVSKLLAVRAFQPSSALLAEAPRMAEVLRLWIRGVLSEYGLTEANLASTTTEAGSDIKRLCDVLLPCPWDWCTAHMLDCALVEAFGTSLSRDQSGNPDARAVMVRVKKVIETVNMSEPTKLQLSEIQLEDLISSLILLSDVPQRWKSTVNCLERVLELFDVLRMTFLQLEKSFDLDEANMHTLLCELYSLMHPVAKLITEAQACTPNAAIVMVALCATASHLDPAKPLPVTDPGQRLLDPTGFRPCLRPADELQPLTIHTRALLLAALRTRFFSPYASTSPQSRSLMMDMATFLFPPLRALRVVEPLVKAGAGDSMSAVEIADQARLIISCVHDEIIAAAVKVSEHQSPASSIVESGKMARVVFGGFSSQPNPFSWLPMEQFGEFRAATPAASPARTAPHADLARAELRRYLDLPSSEVAKWELPSQALAFWRSHRGDFPLLSAVARSILGKPVSSAAERDFGEGGASITPRRNRLDAGCVEMSLFLRQNMDSIPPLNTIPQMTAEQAKEAFPKRFCGADFLQTEKLWRAEDDAEGDAEDDAEGKDDDLTGDVSFV